MSAPQEKDKEQDRCVWAGRRAVSPSPHPTWATKILVALLVLLSEKWPRDPASSLPADMAGMGSNCGGTFRAGKKGREDWNAFYFECLWTFAFIIFLFLKESFGSFFF